MNAILFDKLAYVEALQGSRISKKEATAHAAALDAAMREGVATSADIAELKTQASADIAELRHEIELQRTEVEARLRELELRLTVRLGGMLVTGIAVVAALVKLL